MNIQIQKPTPGRLLQDQFAGKAITKTERSWAVFDYWFNWHGHWVFGTSDADKARAEEAWRTRGIDSLPDYPGPRPL